MRTQIPRPMWRLPIAFAALVVVLATGDAAAASAENVIPVAQAPGWEVNSHSYPTNLVPGKPGIVAVGVYNVGAADAAHGAIVTDTLPKGVIGISNGWKCSIAPSSNLSTCTQILSGFFEDEGKTRVGERLEPSLEVEVEQNAAEGEYPNVVTIVGGGAPTPATATNLLTISSRPAGFGFASADAWFTNADGTADTQAGSHPYEVSFNFDLNAEADNSPAANASGQKQEARDITVNLPPGLIGNANALPQCTREQFDFAECPASTQIGIAPTGLGGNGGPTPITFRFPVYNLTPPPGKPAEFGYQLFGIHVFLEAHVRSGGTDGPLGNDYGITEQVNAVPQRHIVTSDVTLWGVPSEPSHDAQRCTHLAGEVEKCGYSSTAARIPFLTLPTSCEGPQEFSALANTWLNESSQSPIKFNSHDAQGHETGFTGCDHLGFSPTISVQPDTAFADTPAGLAVEVKVPQEGLLDANALATSNLKDTTVTLPPGVVINPGQAAGLIACQKPEENLESEGPPSCPNGAKVGTVEIQTPLVKDALHGDVYVLQSNPPDLQLLLDASGDGVHLKLIGHVHLNEATGQLTSTFENTPELPFTNFKLLFSGGAQAALATPAQCGVYTTDSNFTPWSTPLVANALSEDSFGVSSGPGGGVCPSNPLPFHPELIAGATTDQAGGFTNFSLLLRRGDGQQRIEKLQFKAPPGLGGMLSAVPQCQEPQAALGTCSAASQIGHSTIDSGPGPYPLVVPQPGDPESPIYLTGPYGGAPFGLTIVTHVIAGPFNLGTVITRAKIEVDPHTAQITITTEPLPQVVAGVPTDLRLVNAVIDRPGFMFNPTNCAPSSFSGTAWGTPPAGVASPGASAPISSPFQVGSCRSLEFTPKFSVSTPSSDNFNRNGAALVAKVAYPNVPQGSQADIAKFKVELPKALPSRLTTLQKACTNAQFELNPANCPAASKIGFAVVHTPEVPVPLEGPAIFVSHGGEAFPSLTLVLQGDGVTISLVGTTFISHAGITSTTFKAVPDATFSTFELTLPEGPYSALASNTNVCKPTRNVTVKKSVSERIHGKLRKVTKNVSAKVAAPLEMPTEIIGQNGAEIHEVAKIAVTGCKKSPAKKAAKKKAGQRRKKK